MSANTLRKSGAYRVRPPAEPTVVRPHSVEELRAVLDAGANLLPPFRPMGSGSSATECNTAIAGTVIDLTAMNQVSDIDLHDYTVTVQPGVRLRDLAATLAEQGLELEGSYDLANRTVGGAVAGGCIGPAIGDDGALFASQVCNLKLVTPSGTQLSVGEEKRN
ncbi:MAG: FAD-dependent oxidoreductase, partial [Woeseia sp.]